MNLSHFAKFSLLVTVATSSTIAIAKLPLPPPPDPTAVAAKAEKDKVAADAVKVQQAAAEEKAVKSFQANMKKAGKTIPKPTPIVVAAPSPATVTAPTAPAAPAAPVAKDTTPPKEGKTPVPAKN